MLIAIRLFKTMPVARLRRVVSHTRLAGGVNAMLGVLALSLAQFAAAASTPAPSSGVFFIPGGGTKNAAGVIDRPISRSLNATASEATPSQFNRLADHAAFTSAPEAAVEPDGGPALYTILQRAPSAARQTRPVVYTPAITPPSVSKPRLQPLRNRFCTVTEVARSASSTACR